MENLASWLSTSRLATGFTRESTSGVRLSGRFCWGNRSRSAYYRTGLGRTTNRLGVGSRNSTAPLRLFPTNSPSHRGCLEFRAAPASLPLQSDILRLRERRRASGDRDHSDDTKKKRTKNPRSLANAPVNDRHPRKE